MADRVEAIAEGGIPGSGPPGLTPQSAGALGGFRLQGKDAARAKRIVDDARVLEEAGAFSIILELVPDRLAALVTARSQGAIVMGLGSGPDVHGQLLIYHDAFGLYPRFKPRMAKVFADAGAVIREGLDAYVREVSDRSFPQPEHWFPMKDDEYDELVRLLDVDAEEAGGAGGRRSGTRAGWTASPRPRSASSSSTGPIPRSSRSAAGTRIRTCSRSPSCAPSTTRSSRAPTGASCSTR